MAYNPQNLSVIAYANGFTRWPYVTDEPAADVVQPQYFSPAEDMLRKGDFIDAEHSSDDPQGLMLMVSKSLFGRVDTKIIGATTETPGEQL